VQREKKKKEGCRRSSLQPLREEPSVLNTCSKGKESSPMDAARRKRGRGRLRERRPALGKKTGGGPLDALSRTKTSTQQLIRGKRRGKGGALRDERELEGSRKERQTGEHQKKKTAAVLSVILANYPKEKGRMFLCAKRKGRRDQCPQRRAREEGRSGLASSKGPARFSIRNAGNRFIVVELRRKKKRKTSDKEKGGVPPSM